jgi:Zn-dependent protease with chaperone function
MSFNSVLRTFGFLLALTAKVAGLCTPAPRAIDGTYLDGCRPAPISPSEKAMVLSSLPREGEAVGLSTAEREKMDALTRALAAHGREKVYVLKIVDSPVARTGLHARAVLLVTRAALALLSADELTALAAHEVGHEYIWEAWQTAQRESDRRRVRELELHCDAVAALTLLRIGIPPDRLVSALRRIEEYNSAHFVMDTSGYPSLAERGAIIARAAKQARIR